MHPRKLTITVTAAVGPGQETHYINAIPLAAVQQLVERALVDDLTERATLAAGHARHFEQPFLVAVERGWDVLTPNHGQPFQAVDPNGNEGRAINAYYRADNPARLCTCVDCEAAHAAASRTPDSPFHQGMLVACPEGVGIVYQTSEQSTFVDLLEHEFLVVKYPTSSCQRVLAI